MKIALVSEDEILSKLKDSRVIEEIRKEIEYTQRKKRIVPKTLKEYLYPTMEKWEL